MLYKMLDRLLETHFKESSHKCPAGLEQDVWRSIQTIRADRRQPWYDKVALAFAVPQFRMASLVMALAIGISVGPALEQKPDTPSNKDMLGMDVFTAQAPHLPSNLIEHMK